MKALALNDIYTSDKLEFQKERYLKAKSEFENIYDEKAEKFFSATELSFSRSADAVRSPEITPTTTED